MPTTLIIMSWLVVGLVAAALLNLMVEDEMILRYLLICLIFGPISLAGVILIWIDALLFAADDIFIDLRFWRKRK